MCILFISGLWTRASQRAKLTLSLQTRLLRHSSRAEAGFTPRVRNAFMGSLSKRQIASGIALVVAALFVVVLHSLNYSKEHQLYGIALVGVFGFLFLSRDKAPEPDEPWWR